MTIEQQFDVRLIAGMALKEKQIQQNYRPIIAVHKWFARRPGTLFRGLILSEFADRPLAESFFKANDFPQRLVVDPFMGGGVPILEANRVGCDVQGFDINPMATWIVREEIEHLDLDAYRNAARSLIKALTAEIGAAYRTDCPLYGEREVPVKYFLWVKNADCEQCGHTMDLFPGYLVADDTRHPRHVLVCSECGELNQIDDRKRPGNCRHCNVSLTEHGPARRNRCSCKKCGHINAYPTPNAGPPRHRMFAIEYHNPHRRHEHRGRFFKKPDVQDLARYEYCDKPFEVRSDKGRRVFVPIKGEWIGEHSNGARPRAVSIHCRSATTLALQANSLDAVFTDPPYFGNVQYGELMDFCYVWLRRLIGTEAEGFDRESTRSLEELTGNLTEARDLVHFTDGLSAVYLAMACALKVGAPLVFTFHHNRIDAYHAVGVAILDAGLTCSTTLPCPAEMGGSIHIHGTRSSIVDTVFVCRATGQTRRSLLFESTGQLRQIIENDLARLCAAGMKPTVGDVRCITFGHLTRMTVWQLRQTWDRGLSTGERTRRFAVQMKSLADVDMVVEGIGASLPRRRFEFAEEESAFELDVDDAVPF